MLRAPPARDKDLLWVQRPAQLPRPIRPDSVQEGEPYPRGHSSPVQPPCPRSHGFYAVSVHVPLNLVCCQGLGKPDFKYFWLKWLLALFQNDRFQANSWQHFVTLVVVLPKFEPPLPLPFKK